MWQFLRFWVSLYSSVTWRSADKPRVTHIVTGLDCDTIQTHHEKFSSLMKHGLSSHISCGCKRTVGNFLLTVLSFPNFRRDHFERGNFVVAKTPHMFTDSRGSKASWHAVASANIGLWTLRMSKSTKTVNYLSRLFGLSYEKFTQSHEGEMPAAFVLYKSYGSLAFLHSTAL